MLTKGTRRRDGLLLLLANAKRLWKPLAAKQLLIVAPLVVAALAARTVGSIVKERMSRPRKIGIIQGSPLSPLLANIYLHPFYKAMTRAGIRLVRYADDLLLLCRSESRARHALQYAIAADPARCLELAKCFVRGKLTNAIRFCQRQRTQNDEVKSAIRSTREILRKLEGAKNLESLLGYEGAGAAAHYRAFRQLLTRDWGFTTREFRPPPDPINAMLSLGYTLLHNHVYAFTNVVGLDPYCGYFHQPKHGHAALASDLMEEFRQILVDGYVLSLVNNNRVRPDDFEQTNKGIRFTKEALERFLTGYYGRMQQTFQHPTRNEKTTYLRCIELQVRHLARVIKGEDPMYEPFLIRT